MSHLIISLATTLLLVSVPLGGVRAQENSFENVRLVFQLIEADGFPDIDPAISEVVQELQKLFRFDGYRLLTTSVLSGAIRGAAPTIISQALAVGDQGKLELEAWLEAVSGPAVRVSVKLRDARHRSTYEGRAMRLPEVLNVSVNVRNGQTVVLGSTRLTAESAALILVMTAEFDPQ